MWLCFYLEITFVKAQHISVILTTYLHRNKINGFYLGRSFEKYVLLKLKN